MVTLPCFIIVLITLTFTKASIYKNLKHFDTFHADSIQHTIVKRGLKESNNQFNKIKEVNFKTLGRNFRLIINPKSKNSVLHSKFKAFAVDGDGRETSVHVDHESFYDGRVFGETASHVSVHIEDGVLTGNIHVPDEVYHIEPSWRHLPHLDNGTMIAYRQSDVKLSWDHANLPPGQMGPKVCGYVKEGRELDEDNHENPHKLSKRQVDQSYAHTSNKTRCPLLLVADYQFFRAMGGSNTKTTINYLISLIDRVDKIYTNTVWKDREEDVGFKGMGFVIKKIVVHNSYTNSGEEHYNTRKDWNVRTLLEVFSKTRGNDKVCLAHLFTHQRFISHNSGILGLAYIASPKINNVGGICSKPALRQNGDILYLNAGLTSSRNHYEERVITREADLVTTHEFGHNWGSEHDPNIAECSPSARQGGSYLMYTYSVSGYDVNNKRFSPCSLRSIRKVLQAKADLCFIQPEESFCGNSRVENNEECDAGLFDTVDNDTCCTKDCKLRPDAHCSDKNSPCCQNCKYMTAGVKCRDAQIATCEQESKCSGQSANCPESMAMPNDTDCLEKGKCQNGRCVPYCETQNKQSCMCDTIENACMRCCRESKGATCSPVDSHDILPDGTPCIQGFCINGHCDKKVQDVVERLWDLIEHININKVLLFLRDNMVGTVVIFSALLWIPTSFVISYVDRKRRKEAQELMERRYSRDLIGSADQRRVIEVRVPRPRHESIPE